MNHIYLHDLLRNNYGRGLDEKLVSKTSFVNAPEFNMEDVCNTTYFSLRLYSINPISCRHIVLNCIYFTANKYVISIIVAV